MGNVKTVTLTESELITACANAAANFIRDIRISEGVDDVVKDTVANEVSEITMHATAYLVALLFGEGAKKND